jgi:hypothetical protein
VPSKSLAQRRISLNRLKGYSAISDGDVRLARPVYLFNNNNNNDVLHLYENSRKIGTNSIQFIPMASHHPNAEIPYEKRVAIVVLRLLCGHTFHSITDKLQLQYRAAKHVYSRALERTEPHLQDSFTDVVKNAKAAANTPRITGILTIKAAIP